MQKIKLLRTADCVVGGFRYASKGERSSARSCSGSTTTTALLHHVGFSSAMAAASARSSTPTLEKLVAAARLHRPRAGRPEPLEHASAPANGSRSHRSSSSRSTTTTSRGAASATARDFLRWRPDKAPRQCTLAPVESEARALGALAILGG